MKKLLLALALVMAVSSMGLAAVENIKISGDITSSAVTRDLSLGDESSAIDSQDFLLTQVRVRLDADLTENVAAVVQLINERYWCTETSASTDIDLDLAYVVLSEMLYDPLTVTVGRQNIKFGRGLIVGDRDTDNAVASGVGLDTVANDLSLRKAFDAVRATLNYDKLVIDLVYSKVSEGTLNIEDDVTLYGFNAGYDISDETMAEVYLLAKDKDAATAGYDNDRVATVGGRIETSMVDNLDLYAEYAYQFGGEYSAGVTKLSRDAYAVQVGAVYNFQDERKSKVGVEYTYLSGDDDSTDSDQQAWDPMFEDQRVGEIANLLFDNTNLQYVKLSASSNLREDIRAAIDAYYLRLAEKSSDAISNNTVIDDFSYSLNSDEKDLGWEIDTSLVYDYTEDVQLGLVAGWYIPGDYFTDSNDETAYSVRGSVKVAF